MATITVKGRDGNVTFTNSVDFGRPKVEELAKKLLDNKFFELKDKYITPRGVEVADAPVMEIYLKINNREKIVVIDPYVTDYMPENLKAINELLLSYHSAVLRPEKKGDPLLGYLFTFEIENDGQCGLGRVKEYKGEFLVEEKDITGIPFSGHIITPTPCDSIEMRSATNEIDGVPTLDLIITDKPSSEPCIECLGISKFSGKLLFWPKYIEQVRLTYKGEVLDVIKEQVLEN